MSTGGDLMHRAPAHPPIPAAGGAARSAADPAAWA